MSWSAVDSANDLRDVPACFNTCFAQKFAPRSNDKRRRSSGAAGRAPPLYSRRDFWICHAVNIPRPRSSLHTGRFQYSFVAPSGRHRHPFPDASFRECRFEIAIEAHFCVKPRLCPWFHGLTADSGITLELGSPRCRYRIAE